MTWTRLIATVLGIGLLRPAPGSWGALAALPVAWALHVMGGFALLVVATAAVAAIGTWATTRQIAGQDDQDPAEIVIDEVTGQWIALWPVSAGAWLAGADILALWPGWIAAFVLFRLLDVFKPGPVGRADRLGGARGVMLDDILAGSGAALGVVLLAGISHAVMLL